MFPVFVNKSRRQNEGQKHAKHYILGTDSNPGDPKSLDLGRFRQSQLPRFVVSQSRDFGITKIR